MLNSTQVEVGAELGKSSKQQVASNHKQQLASKKQLVASSKQQVVSSKQQVVVSSSKQQQVAGNNNQLITASSSKFGLLRLLVWSGGWMGGWVGAGGIGSKTKPSPFQLKLGVSLQNSLFGIFSCKYAFLYVCPRRSTFI